MNDPAMENNLRVARLSALLSSLACFVRWNFFRVTRDFRRLKHLLTEARWQTAGKDKSLVARFSDQVVSITDNDTGIEGVYPTLKNSK